MSGRSGLKLFSCYWFGEKPDSRHQIKMFFVDRDEDVINLQYFFITVNSKFVAMLWKSTPVELIEEFLNYHFDKYGGVKSIYLRCLEEIIDKEIKRRKAPNLRDPIILDWIKNKKAELATTGFIPDFDYSNKEGYFYTYKIDEFKLIEANLVQYGFIKSPNIWDTEQNKLVALIHILLKLNYLKPVIENKRDRSLLKKYRVFFSKRYAIDIQKAFQPSQFDISKLKNYKADYYFIPDIENL